MELRLQELRRYAIDRRVEVKCTDTSSGRRIVINLRGQVRIPDEDRDFRVETVVGAADAFEICEEAKPRQLTRDQMVSALADHFQARGFAAAAKDEED
jgi:hypothetical protein